MKAKVMQREKMIKTGGNPSEEKNKTGNCILLMLKGLNILS